MPAPSRVETAACRANRSSESIAPTRAPRVGEHNDDVLSDVLGYGADRIKVLKESGALG